MSNYFTKADQAESVQYICDALASATKNGNERPIIYTILRTVSKSGMMRRITPFVINATTGELISLAWHYERANGRLADDTGAKWACKVSGCGMDMGFHLACNIASIAGHGSAHDAMIHRWA